jgi:hypothetical protein
VALLGLLGLGSAVAVAAVTQSTSVSCATTQAASHTVGVDGTPVTTVGGDSLSVCATATATDQTVTVTVTTPGTTTATPTTTTSPVASGTPGIGAICESGCLTNITDPNLYSVVIGGAWSGDVASVTEKVVGRGLSYFDGTDVKQSFSTGVPYTDALNNGWLLKSSTGALLTNSSFGSYCADVGSTGYQDEWIRNVEGYLVAHPGVDGVFIDNVLYDPKGDCGGYPAKYPTTAAWAAAMVSFVQAVYATLNAKGYYVALNAGAFKSGDSTYNDGTSTVNWWKQVGPYSSGLMNENYDQTSQGLRTSANAWYGDYDGWQRLIGTAQGMGKDFLGLTKSGGMNTTVAIYGKASFLLEWNGGGSAYLYTCGTACDPTNSAWTTDIGQPAGEKVAVGVGYERSYTNGAVLVNPSPSVSQTFTVGGVSYTLAPTTAKIINN